MAKSVLLDYDAEGFAEFWAAYPRREAKKDAWKAWCQKRPTFETQAKICEALSWQIPAHKWDLNPQYCPLPATYLRGERWTDERRQMQRPISNVTAAAMRALHEAGE